MDWSQDITVVVTKKHKPFFFFFWPLQVKTTKRKEQRKGKRTWESEMSYPAEEEMAERKGVLNPIQRTLTCEEKHHHLASQQPCYEVYGHKRKKHTEEQQYT